MSFFKDIPSTYEKIDYKIVSNGWNQLYFNKSILSKDLEWLEKEGYEIINLDCNGYANLMEQLRAKLSFPDYFHHNLNSLNDCMRDIEIKGIGIVFVFKNIDSLTIDLSNAFLDIFINTARMNFIFGKRMLVLAQVEDKDFQIDNLGSIEMRWNNKEWLDSARR
jgi:RNAse (barnase) inhibitor barstar